MKDKSEMHCSTLRPHSIDYLEDAQTVADAFAKNTVSKIKKARRLKDALLFPCNPKDRLEKAGLFILKCTLGTLYS